MPENTGPGRIIRRLGIRKKDMGQPTGFLEYARVGLKERTPEERLKDFEDFHVPLSDAERRKQVTAA